MVIVASRALRLTLGRIAVAPLLLAPILQDCCSIANTACFVRTVGFDLSGTAYSSPVHTRTLPISASLPTQLKTFIKPRDPSKNEDHQNSHIKHATPFICERLD